MVKLKLNTGQGASQDAKAATPRTADPTAQPPTPASASGGSRFKIRINASQPSTPAEPPVSTIAAPPQPANVKKPRNPGSVAGRQPEQPKRKASGPGGGGSGRSKRAANDDSISPAAKRLANGAQLNRRVSLKLPPRTLAAAQNGAPQSAIGSSHKLMLKRKSTGKLRALNVKRPPPQRLPGHGYDSEDSEAEEDPSIQQSFVLRMQPGEDCDYVRDAIVNGKIGLPPSEGGAEISIRFLDKDFRRAVVTVRGRMYAAVLVDLPCIVESMKSWDRKGWYKVADINQMLLVLGRCTSDDEAKIFPLPTREVDKNNLQYAHGLTPPMRWVRKRRFRKRVSYKTIANVEEEVERLLKEDEAAEAQGGEVTWEFFDRAEMERSPGAAEEEESGYGDAGEDMDAEGEAIETVEGEGLEFEEYYDDEGDAADLEGNLQAMFDEDAATTQLVTVESPVPLPDHTSAVDNILVAETPIADTDTQAETPADEQSSSDEDEDEDEEPDSPDLLDEDAAAKAAERNQQLEEVADLEREVQNQRVKAENMKNQLLKERALQQLRILEEDLRVKRGSFGLDADGEDEEQDEAEE